MTQFLCIFFKKCFLDNDNDLIPQKLKRHPLHCIVIHTYTKIKNVGGDYVV